MNETTSPHHADGSVANAPLAKAIRALDRPVELLLLALLVGLEFVIFGTRAEPLLVAANILGPVALVLILGWSCYQIASDNALGIWAPLFWFRLASLTYFGFGNFVPFLLNEYSERYFRTIYAFDQIDLIKLNLVCSLAILMCLAFSSVFLNMMNSNRKKSVGHSGVRSDSTLKFAIAFLVIGGSVRYFIDVPVAFGLVPGPVPGLVIQMEKAFYAGIYLLTYYAVLKGGASRLIALSLIIFEIVISIATFAKYSLLMILIFPFLGLLSARVSLFRSGVAVVCVLFAYFAFQPVVSYGRDALVRSHGLNGGAGLGERIQYATDYYRYGQTGDPGQYGLTRLSYANVGSYVINQYDAGNPGQTFSDFATVLVPRFLWPDKPNITRAGGQLFTQVYRRQGSQLGVGFFPEAYWNFGWAGLIWVMAILAAVLSTFSVVSLSVMTRQDWLFLPIVFMGVQIGIRVDGFFVPDVIGTAGIAAMVGLAILMISRLMASGRLIPHIRRGRVKLGRVSP